MAIETSLIRRIEERSLNAWAAPRSLLLDGWIARFAYGFTKRANSVSVLYSGEQPISEKIKFCQQLYNQQNLPLIFRISPIAPAELDRQLDELGFAPLDSVSVQTKDLSQFDPVEIETLEIWLDYSYDWLDYSGDVWGWEESSKRYLFLKEILYSIVPTKAFAIIRERHETIATGLAVLEGNDVGLFEIATRESHRRQGYGRSIVLGLLSWAKQQGATTAYLQVVVDNQPALQLYNKLGFAELYQYFYRIQNRSSSEK